MEALFAGAIDAAYIGPSPTINAHVKSKGKAVRIVSGATAGGASLVVRPGINRPADLRGRKLAAPALGNTQDVALTELDGGGDVSVQAQENPQTLETFRSGAIDGAWVPEPWATRLVEEGGGRRRGHALAGGRFVTANLVVRTQFLNEHPDAVRRLVKAQIAANDFLNSNPQESMRIVNDTLAGLTGKRLADKIIAEAWGHLVFTNDPIAPSLRASAKDAVALGLLTGVDLDGIYDLRFLNEALRTAGRPHIKG